MNNMKRQDRGSYLGLAGAMSGECAGETTGAEEGAGGLLGAGIARGEAGRSRPGPGSSRRAREAPRRDHERSGKCRGLK